MKSFGVLSLKVSFRSGDKVSSLIFTRRSTHATLKKFLLLVPLPLLCSCSIWWYFDNNWSIGNLSFLINFKIIRPILAPKFLVFTKNGWIIDNGYKMRATLTSDNVNKALMPKQTNVGLCTHTNTAPLCTHTHTHKHTNTHTPTESQNTDSTHHQQTHRQAQQARQTDEETILICAYWSGSVIIIWSK